MFIRDLHGIALHLKTADTCFNCSFRMDPSGSGNDGISSMLKGTLI